MIFQGPVCRQAGVLGNGSDKLLRSIYLKVFLVFATRQFGTVKNRARCLVTGQLLKGEGVANDVLGKRNPSFIIVFCNPRLVVNAEAGVSPASEFLDYVIINFSFFFKHGKDFCAKYFLKQFQVNVRHCVECAALSEKSVPACRQTGATIACM